MQIKHDKELCVGCGLCCQEYPKYFKMVGDKAKLIIDKTEDETMIEVCPVGAIVIHKEEDDYEADKY